MAANCLHDGWDSKSLTDLFSPLHYLHDYYQTGLSYFLFFHLAILKTLFPRVCSTYALYQDFQISNHEAGAKFSKRVAYIPLTRRFSCNSDSHLSSYFPLSRSMVLHYCYRIASICLSIQYIHQKDQPFLVCSKNLVLRLILLSFMPNLWHKKAKTQQSICKANIQAAKH